MTAMETIRVLSLALILTSFAAIELRNLRGALWAYMLQALLLVAIIFVFATLHPPLFIWGITALLTKFAIISWLLGQSIHQGEPQEYPPLIELLPSVFIIGLLALATYRLTHTYTTFLAPTKLATQEPFRTNIAVSLTVFLIGLYGILTRRDAIKVVIGLCLMENGAHLSLVSLAPGVRETVLIGIVTDVVIAVWLILYIINEIRRQFGSTDSFRLSELRW
ncbi:MAG: NADH-quinone oxidoreductase subunit K [Armatimonadetes bacterium]|nr:NADH-quinone oxidoreductase subunit K [Armatimonadota bacterium]MCX7967314.1 NADH-quinone oxidoreductase subunit K [Armatimonadota bacterium]MDW8143092.1 NADH-quinone oxidoreductase subunit K [Armatimonadota bacterium]